MMNQNNKPSPHILSTFPDENSKNSFISVNTVNIKEEQVEKEENGQDIGHEASFVCDAATDSEAAVREKGDMSCENEHNRENSDMSNEIQEKMDKYDGDELKIAIYQFLNGSNLEDLKDNPDKQSITESNDFIQLTKDKDTPYSCGVCSREFNSVSGLVIHLRIHTGDQPFDCTECGKGFTNRANLHKHVRIHKNIRPYECDICGAKFTLNQNMQSHKLTHTGEKPHSCSLCGKSFSRAHHVKRHMETHSLTPEKNHECNVCCKSFGRKENLQAHMKTHTKAINECMFCGQYFNGDGRLRFHIKKKHAEENKTFQITTSENKLSANMIKTDKTGQC